MYYTTQPMEMPDNIELLETTFRAINAETQLLWSSDYPHWDMDSLSVIWDLPFIGEEANGIYLVEPRKRFSISMSEIDIQPMGRSRLNDKNYVPRL